MTVGDILKDFRSIKVPAKVRDFIDGAREYFEKNGNVSWDTQKRLRQLCKRYNLQLRELHESRERAIRTNSLRKLGITKAEAARREQDRQETLNAKLDDVGF